MEQNIHHDCRGGIHNHSTTQPNTSSVFSISSRFSFGSSGKTKSEKQQTVKVKSIFDDEPLSYSNSRPNLYSTGFDSEIASSNSSAPTALQFKKVMPNFIDKPRGSQNFDEFDWTSEPVGQRDTQYSSIEQLEFTMPPPPETSFFGGLIGQPSNSMVRRQEHAGEFSSGGHGSLQASAQENFNMLCTLCGINGHLIETCMCVTIEVLKTHKKNIKSNPMPAVSVKRITPVTGNEIVTVSQTDWQLRQQQQQILISQQQQQTPASSYFTAPSQGHVVEASQRRPYENPSLYGQQEPSASVFLGARSAHPHQQHQQQLQQQQYQQYQQYQQAQLQQWQQHKEQQSVTASIPLYNYFFPASK